MAAAMIRPGCVALLVLIGGCSSTPDEATAPAPEPVNTRSPQEDVSAEWQMFTKINADYFRQAKSEPPAAAEETDAPPATTTSQDR